MEDGQQTDEYQSSDGNQKMTNSDQEMTIGDQQMTIGDQQTMIGDQQTTTDDRWTLVASDVSPQYLLRGYWKKVSAELFIWFLLIFIVVSFRNGA